MTVKRKRIGFAMARVSDRFVIGVTNPMQSKVENARLEARYADGGAETLCSWTMPSPHSTIGAVPNCSGQAHEPTRGQTMKEGSR